MEYVKDGDIVSLENGLYLPYDDRKCIEIRPGESVLYDNVVIEDILSDKDLDRMDVDDIVMVSQMGGVMTDCEPKASTSGCADGNGPKKKTRTFKQPETEAKINELSFKNFAVESKRKIRWAVNLYGTWRENRMKENFCPHQIVRADLSLIMPFDQVELSFALSRFITEVKKVDNTDYPPNTVRELVLMIQMHLHQNGVYWKLLDGEAFHRLRNVLDNVMKQRTAMGLGVCQSSEVISMQHENKMFETGALGESDLITLLRTVIYMLGLHLALRGGIEHCRLRRPGFNCQIVTENDESNGKEMLVYREDPLQKNNQGGLGSRFSNKTVKVHPASDSRKCPVRLFVKYVNLLPQSKSCGKLYLRPKTKVTPNCWYCDQPFGKNKIWQTVKKLCEIAKISGKFTNHSLRATSASRMFQANVPEQIIKEVTGHRSECVRVYKKTSDEMLQNASSTISDSKEVKTETCSKRKSIEDDVEVSESDRRCLKESLSACQIIKNVIKTHMEMRKKCRKPLVRKVANRILRAKKKQISHKSKGNSREDRIVIDLNVNVTGLK